MLKIRLQRVGRKNQPTFRVVLSDSRRSAKTGSVMEILGWRNPTKHEHVFEKERILHWLGKGAQASGTVHNFLIQEGIIKGVKADVASRPKRSEAKEGEGVKEAAPKTVAPAQKKEEGENAKALSPEAGSLGESKPEDSGTESGEKAKTEVAV